MASVLLGLWLAGFGTRFLVLSSPAPAISAPINGLNQAIDTTDSFRQYPDLDDVALDRLAAHLTELLEDENADAPLVYIEGPGPLDDLPVGGPEVWKRSRYYRRYPWKRQNRGYDPEGYLCNPSREDVFQLLVALHEAREGNLSRTVSFCNRRRPARAIFTNIRFLGRRK